jgi:hypothetical protein
MRGTGNWERPYFAQVQGETVWLETAVSYDPEAQLPQPMIRQQQTVQLQFLPGVLTALTLEN